MKFKVNLPKIQFCMCCISDICGVDMCEIHGYTDAKCGQKNRWSMDAKHDYGENKVD